MKNNKENKYNVVIACCFMILFIALSYISFARLGIVGSIFANIFSFLFGEGYLFVLLSLISYWLYRLIANKNHQIEIKMIFGFILLNLFYLLLEGTLMCKMKSYNDLSLYVKNAFPYLFKIEIFPYKAGLFGSALYLLFVSLFALEGTIMFIVAGFIIAIILLIPFAIYVKAYQKIKDDLSLRKEKRKLLKKQRQALAREENLKKKMKKEVEASLPVLDEKTVNSKKSVFLDLVHKEKKSTIDSVQVIPIKDVNKKNITKEENTIKTSAIKQSPLAIKNYRLPPLNLLVDSENFKKTSVNRTSAVVKGQRILELLHNFGIEASLINTHIGPSVTKFEIKPDSSVKVAKILSLQDNIKMELAAKDVRIEAPIPGRNAVGIEIPNVEAVPVMLKELMLSLPSEKKQTPLLFHLGKDLMGKGVYCELGKMPHLLIAGATGSGKSVCINTIIMSLIMQSNPNDVKLILVDPKKVEFSPYHDIPHLLWPVITDVNLASSLLQRVVVIMEDRYDTFASVGVKNIQSYNEYAQLHNKQHKEEGLLPLMPYIVVIIDELADMMALAGKDVEMSIQRITQLARASGIHLIVATQRPSTDVITGIIKANIPSRISFAVASSIDSRTILDATGAERLLGNGDMLYFPQGQSSPTRLQGAYVKEKEINNVTSYLKKMGKPEYDDAYFELVNNHKLAGESSSSRIGEEDSLLEEVIAYIKAEQKASTSLLQRRFGIGYNRAARLIDNLEEKGYIGPINGSKPREVFIKDDEDNV